MKSHAIIPIFIPHKGCPNSCVFCNQNIITANEEPVSANTAAGVIDAWLDTLKNKNLKTVEVAFFGGSFTGLPVDSQSEYLEIASFYKGKGSINKIRLSTRPDFIDEGILLNLARYGVDTIELGVQSFDDEVLKKSNRGHTACQVCKSSFMIRDYGFGLGIQLMIGLPGDTPEKCVFSANETVRIKPESARLYPAVILEGTELHNMYLAGSYTPLSTEEAVNTTKQMYKIISSAGINILRVGLKGSFHPAFRQIVESEIAKDELELHLSPDPSLITFVSNEKSFPNMIGHNKSNKIYFSEKYPRCKFKYIIDNSLADGRYDVRNV